MTDGKKPMGTQRKMWNKDREFGEDMGMHGNEGLATG